ncbi:hypothetical protein EMIT0P294_10775 [Pseudomonas sp. IT-P294]
MIAIVCCLNCKGPSQGRNRSNVYGHWLTFSPQVVATNTLGSIFDTSAWTVLPTIGA